MSEHTPGPWTYDVDAGCISGAEIEGNIICEPPPAAFPLSAERWPANARLITAAPDLLAACEAHLAMMANPNIFESLGQAQAALNLMRAAVAKAKT